MKNVIVPNRAAANGFGDLSGTNIYRLVGDLYRLTLNCKFTSCISELANWSSVILDNITKHSIELFAFASVFVSCITIELTTRYKH